MVEESDGLTLVSVLESFKGLCDDWNYCIDEDEAIEGAKRLHEVLVGAQCFTPEYISKTMGIIAEKAESEEPIDYLIAIFNGIQSIHKEIGKVPSTEQIEKVADKLFKQRVDLEKFAERIVDVLKTDAKQVAITKPEMYDETQGLSLSSVIDDIKNLDVEWGLSLDLDEIMLAAKTLHGAVSQARCFTPEYVSAVIEKVFGNGMSYDVNHLVGLFNGLQSIYADTGKLPSPKKIEQTMSKIYEINGEEAVKLDVLCKTAIEILKADTKPCEITDVKTTDSAESNLTMLSILGEFDDAKSDDNIIDHVKEVYETARKHGIFNNEYVHRVFTVVQKECEDYTAKQLAGYVVKALDKLAEVHASSGRLPDADFLEKIYETVDEFNFEYMNTYCECALVLLDDLIKADPIIKTPRTFNKPISPVNAVKLCKTYPWDEDGDDPVQVFKDIAELAALARKKGIFTSDYLGEILQLLDRASEVESNEAVRSTAISIVDSLSEIYDRVHKLPSIDYVRRTVDEVCSMYESKPHFSWLAQALIHILKEDLPAESVKAPVHYDFVPRTVSVDDVVKLVDERFGRHADHLPFAIQLARLANGVVSPEYVSGIFNLYRAVERPVALAATYLIFDGMKDIYEKHGGHLSLAALSNFLSVARQDFGQENTEIEIAKIAIDAAKYGLKDR